MSFVGDWESASEHDDSDDSDGSWIDVDHSSDETENQASITIQ